MQQLDFFLAQVSCAPKAQVTKRRETAGAGKLQPPAPQVLTIAEQLNRGIKVAFPKEANAVRVTIGGKMTVILKTDADTLKGAGVATAVEFGIVKNDAKGHPIRKGFETLPAVNAVNSVEKVLVLTLQ